MFLLHNAFLAFCLLQMTVAGHQADVFHVTVFYFQLCRKRSHGLEMWLYRSYINWHLSNLQHWATPFSGSVFGWHEKKLPVSTNRQKWWVNVEYSSEHLGVVSQCRATVSWGTKKSHEKTNVQWRLLVTVSQSWRGLTLCCMQLVAVFTACVPQALQSWDGPFCLHAWICE